MQFTSISTKKYFNYKETPAGTVLVTGKLISTSENKYNKKNLDYQIKPLDGGVVVHLYGAGHLSWAMENVNIGDLIQVTYLGTETLNKGDFKGSDAHQFDVAIADDDSQADLFNAGAIKEVEEEFKASPKAVAKKAVPKSKASTVDLSDLD